MITFKEHLKKHPIISTLICIAIICVVILFICSYCNHRSTNRHCRENMNEISLYLKEAKKEIEVCAHCEHMPNIIRRNVYNELNSLLTELDKARNELVKQCHKTFDANTVTFLITFVSALLFTVFISLFVRNMEQYIEMNEFKTRLDDINKRTNSQIEKADKQIRTADNKINELENRITKANEEWNDKLQSQEYMLKLETERNKLIEILNLISVLGSHLALSGYTIKQEYTTLVYMIQRKTRSLLNEKFNEVKSISEKEKTEFTGIITDCITYLNIDNLKELNKVGIVPFEQLYGDLNDIRRLIKNIPQHV